MGEVEECSLYESYSNIDDQFVTLKERYRKILQISKKCGVLVIMLWTLTILTIMVYILSLRAIMKEPTDCKIITTFNANNSICDYKTQFKLPEDYVVSICNSFIDIRRYENKLPTDYGMLFNHRQWEYLNVIASNINSEFYE